MIAATAAKSLLADCLLSMVITVLQIEVVPFLLRERGYAAVFSTMMRACIFALWRSQM